MKNRKLLVEGNDDQHVIWNLLVHHDIPETFVVEEKGGIDKLLAAFPVHAKGSGIQAIAAIVDADVDAARRWQALRHSILQLGFETCPEQIPKEGLVLSEAGKPRVGVWIMPDNSLSGMLEDFVAYLVPENDQLWDYALNSVTSKPRELVEYIDAHRCKVHIHTWLAWKADPGTPMGLAITKRYLNGSAAAVEPFMNWLKRMFVE